MNMCNCFLCREDVNMLLAVYIAFIFHCYIVTFVFTLTSSKVLSVPCGRGKQTIRQHYINVVLNMIDVNKVLIYIQGSRRFICVLLVLQRSDSCAEWNIETELAEFPQLEQTTTNSVSLLTVMVDCNILYITILLPFIYFPQNLIPKSLSSFFIIHFLIKTIKALILRKLSDSKITYPQY